ncbi:MAG: PQQ-like beta-propeller repeat protein [Actinomycetota bacterium]|nr:PQQ-like beta-propeller repeat protein [Actinomycetota bacterium]
MRQRPGRKIPKRTRRSTANRFFGRVRRSAAGGILGRVRLGHAGHSPRLRRWALAVVLLGVILVPYPTVGAASTPPASACRAGCRAASMPNMVRWAAPLPGSWQVDPGLSGTVPAAGLAYVSVGDGIAAVGAGLTVTGYSATTGALRWHATLTGFPAGAAIVSVRTWPGVVTAGVSYQGSGAAPGSQRTEVVLSGSSGAPVGRHPAAVFGGAAAASATYTVIVGATTVTSYDNATGHIRWQRPTGRVAQAWHLDGSSLYVADSAGGFVGSAPVTALRKIDLATGTELLVRPLESFSFDGTFSAAAQGAVLFSSASGVTAYSGLTGATLWTIHGVVPEGADPRAHRIYLIRGSDLIGVNPQTGRVSSTASGSAVDGSAGVYVVRNGVALGLDQGASGDAWGYDIKAQRVTLASAGLPWPHYFVDLSGVGGSADPASNLVVISACTELAPAAFTAPSDSPSTSASSITSASASTASPQISPPASAPARAGRGCLHPELVALRL